LDPGDQLAHHLAIQKCNFHFFKLFNGFIALIEHLNGFIALIENSFC
jgi:hypothetical protein